jgi:O-antigen/teichoic acid export membrane protein
VLGATPDVGLPIPFPVSSRIGFGWAGVLGAAGKAAADRSDDRLNKETEGHPERAPLAEPTRAVGGFADAEVPRGSMSRVVGAGMTWVMLATAISKVGAFLPFIYIPKFMQPSEYGLASLAASVAAMVTWVRDGGARDLLIQRGDAEYRRIESAAFWMALAFNVAGFLVLVGLAVLLPRAAEGNAGLFSKAIEYLGGGSRQPPEQWHNPALPGLLIAWGVWMPVQTFASLQIARLQMLLRFGHTSTISTVSSLIRSVLTVVLAWMGWGPISLVLPMIFCGVIEGVWAYVLLRDRLWSGGPSIEKWGEIFASTKWLMFGVLATNAFDWAGVLSSSFMVNSEVLGRYTFARNIPMQIYIVLSFNLRLVLFPAMSKLKDDPERLRDATLRAMRVQMLLAAPMCVGLALLCEPLIQTLWPNQPEWHQAALAASILSVFFAFRTTFGLTTSVLVAAGRFRAWALLTLVEGIGLGGAAWYGASVHELARYIALAVGLYLMFSRLLMIVYTARVVGLPAKQAILAVIPPWGWSLVVAAASLFLCKAVTDRTPPAVDIAVLFGVFFVLFCYGTRLMMPYRLNEFLRILPLRLQTPVRAVLRMPDFTV